jgi:hypothetical protein
VQLVEIQCFLSHSSLFGFLLFTFAVVSALCSLKDVSNHSL